MVDLSLKYLFQLNNKQIQNLNKLVNDENIMKWIGNGKKWSSSKIQELINYSRNDYNLSFKNTQYLYISILLNNKVIGLCGLHKLPDFPIKFYENKNNYKIIKGLQYMILLNKKYHGRGYSSLILKKVIEINNKIFNNDLYAMTEIINVPGNAMFKKYNKSISPCIIGGKTYNIYKLN